MKKILNIILSLFIILAITSCKDSASKAVIDYLNKYNALDSVVLSDIDDIVDKENITNEDDKKTYIDIFKKQYTDLTYEIESEEYNGDDAIISVKVNVYDLYKVQKEATEYLKDHEEEFNNNGEYDPNLFLSYKLDKMKNTMDRIDYTIDFYVIKDSKEWKITTLSNSDLEKIHGIYNYES